MSKKWSVDNIKIQLNKAEFQLKRIFREAWPINWSNFRSPRTILKVVSETSYPFKVTIVSLTLAFVLSFGFLFYSSYLSLTTVVAAEGGQIRESVIGGEMNIFNPVFDPRSKAESKIVSLLYHPLYEVKYPDFLNNPSKPEIEPILLTKAPEWIDLNEENAENRYKILRFTLRDDIKWSDGSSITMSDMEYTVNRLKEERGNSLFHQVIKDLTFEKLSEREFLLRSKISNPQLVYLLNFRPISETYFDFENNDDLFTDPRTRRPTVTSGFFHFPSGEVQNPDNLRGQAVDNPIRDGDGKNVAVVLEKNPISNTDERILVEKYILTRYDSLLEVAGENDASLESAALSGKVDLYTRFLSSDIDTELTPTNVSKHLKIQQKVVPSNTYYTAYLNMAQGIRSNYIGYLINQSLRNYISCHLLDYSPNLAYQDFVEEIPRDKRLIPLHFNESHDLQCGNVQDILDTNYYSIKVEERTGIKRVLLSGDEIKLTMLGLEESKNLMVDLQIYFRDKIGIPVNLVTDPTEVNKRLDAGEYNIAVLPIKMVIQDPEPLYGSTGRNLSGINQNSRVEEYKVNESLSRYSGSELTDEPAKQNLINFFANEFASINLYRAKQEYNYSKQANGLGKNLPGISTFADDIYLQVNAWYMDTRREWFWGVDEKLRVEN